ncbi:uncharacterized protein LOC101851059 [Aplysia californica]|uniref:Uncharacterized protein LOC101851059 n=1 Tax=Aplysia californica TaxID=6500 RepID=A0ABM0JW95_APLCA|nr:uncharacterized protein LOC101851059 [Aplysia californica]XP_005102993.1 uncharacterized protein LOC101851059 [Aplysia californica]XP_005102994.1 uncharacterized protein LOC101851059 [Aplysia californica]
MKRVLAISLLSLSTVGLVLSTACPPDICDRVDCEPVEPATCTGKVVKNTDRCGCCDVCMDVIKPFQPCMDTVRADPPTAVCQDGYWCDNLRERCTILLPGK